MRSQRRQALLPNRDNATPQALLPNRNSDDADKIAHNL